MINRDGCIACGACYTVDPDHFERDPDGKSNVVGGSTNGISLGSFEDDKYDKAQEASYRCPMNLIAITPTQ
jgi:ferredoxin